MDVKAGDEWWDRIEILGPHLKNLYIAHPYDLGEKCTKAMVRCWNLRELTIDGEYGRAVGDFDVDFLFSRAALGPLQALETLLIARNKPEERNITLIASRTGKLRSLTVELLKPLANGNVFALIVRANPLLENVCVVELYEECVSERSTEDALEIMTCLLKPFAKCSRVQLELVHEEESYVSEESLQELCGIVPCRGINLEVGVGTTKYY